MGVLRTPVGALALLVPPALVVTATSAVASTDLARTGVATASQYQDDGDGSFPPDNVIDGDPGTRSASGNGPDEDVDAAYVPVPSSITRCPRPRRSPIS